MSHLGISSNPFVSTADLPEGQGDGGIAVIEFGNDCGDHLATIDYFSRSHFTSGHEAKRGGLVQTSFALYQRRFVSIQELWLRLLIQPIPNF